MTAASSIPPVLSTRHAKLYRAHLRSCFGEALISATTVTPPHVALAATVVLPSLAFVQKLRRCDACPAMMVAGAGYLVEDDGCDMTVCFDCSVSYEAIGRRVR